jgi:hypothetical protein
VPGRLDQAFVQRRTGGEVEFADDAHTAALASCTTDTATSSSVLPSNLPAHFASEAR